MEYCFSPDFGGTSLPHIFFCFTGAPKNRKLRPEAITLEPWWICRNSERLRSHLGWTWTITRSSCSPSRCVQSQRRTCRLICWRCTLRCPLMLSDLAAPLSHPPPPLPSSLQKCLTQTAGPQRRAPRLIVSRLSRGVVGSSEIQRGGRRGGRGGGGEGRRVHSSLLYAIEGLLKFCADLQSQSQKRGIIFLFYILECNREAPGLVMTYFSERYPSRSTFIPLFAAFI